MRRRLSGPKREGGMELKADLDKRTSQERKLSFISLFQTESKKHDKNTTNPCLHLRPAIENLSFAHMHDLKREYFLSVINLA